MNPLPPTQWSQHFTVIDNLGEEHELYWDLLVSPDAAAQTGIFIYMAHYKSGPQGDAYYWASGFEVHEDTFPRLPEGMDGLDYAISECIRLWNEYLVTEFDISLDKPDHPAGEEIYQECMRRLVYNPDTRQFNPYTEE